MKATCHWPTEQYGYVEIEKEVETAQEALEFYDSAKPAGLPRDEFNKIIDQELLGTIQADPGVTEDMSAIQYATMQEIKKALKRIRARE